MDEKTVLRTPCYVYDEAELSGNLLAFLDAAKSIWPYGDVDLGISVKTAPIAGLVSYAKECGYQAEVVSDEEYRLALNAGFHDHEIIFNGPIKGREALERAINGHAMVNLDSKREIRWVKELASHGIDCKVGLRINFDLESACPGETSSHGEPARFGFCFEDGSLTEAVSELRKSGIEPIGLHAHFSTETHSLKVYSAICDAVCRIAEHETLRSLDYIDIGGGFYGGGDNRSVYSDYVRCISEGLRPLCEKRPMRLVLEPGGSVLATAGSLLGRVIDVKTVREARYIVTELSKLHLNSTLFNRRSFSCAVITEDNKKKLPVQTICGFTCMEMDRIVDLIDQPELSEGDIVQIKNAGAYAASFAPRLFIKSAPEVYLRRRDGSYSPISL